jgi:hypothetical protein
MLKRAENIQEKLAHNLLEFIETWNPAYKIFFIFFYLFLSRFFKERTEYCMFDTDMFWTKDGQTSSARSSRQNTVFTLASNSCVSSVFH